MSYKDNNKKKYGFVTFKDAASARVALKTQIPKIKGINITVKAFISKSKKRSKRVYKSKPFFTKHYQNLPKGESSNLTQKKLKVMKKLMLISPRKELLVPLCYPNHIEDNLCFKRTSRGPGLYQTPRNYYRHRRGNFNFPWRRVRQVPMNMIYIRNSPTGL